MRNFTEMGYETITVIRSEYPPQIGKCLSISPVLWIQSIEKEEKKFFVFSRNNCIKEIYELSQAINDYIDGIITPCGTILPINNKIEFLSSEGIDIECIDGKIRFAIKAPLDPSLGGTGFITYNEGDILVGNKDGKLSILLKGKIGRALGIKEDGTVGYIDVIKKLTCNESDPVTENALVRWDKDSKCLKNGIVIEDNDGNINQQNNLLGKTLKYTISNLSAEPNSHSQLELRTEGENAGNPSVHWSVTGKRDFIAGIDNADDDSWKICPNFVLDNSPYLRIDRTGNVTKPLQIRCLALLPETINNLLGDSSEYFFGTQLKMVKLKDIGNQFYVGDGSFGRADYTSNKNGSYYVEVVHNLYTPDQSQSLICDMISRVRVNGNSRVYDNRGNMPAGCTRAGFTTSFIIDTEIGDKLTFSIQGDHLEKTKNVALFGSNLPIITTAIGVYCLG